MDRSSLSRPREVVIPAAAALLGCLVVSAPWGPLWMGLVMMIGGVFAAAAVVLGFLELRIIDAAGLRPHVATQASVLSGLWVLSGVLAFILASAASGAPSGPAFSWWWVLAPAVAVLTTAIRGITASRARNPIPADLEGDL